MTHFRFPDGFLWGAATSAHQVEGGTHNDWSEWEKENAERLARLAEGKFAHWLSVWPDIKEAATKPENYISGKAADHYNRFREDFDIAKSLGHNAHRFSIEWSRIEPEEGKFDEKEIEHYREMTKTLREKGLEPFVTLWHYTNPIWFEQRGGWLAKDAISLFVRYVSRMAQEFGNDITFWITENEPETFARHGYLLGNRPPGQKNIFQAYRVVHSLFLAHTKARDAILSRNPKAQVGIAETQVFFDAYGHSLLNLLIMKIVKWWRNNPFIKRYIEHSDFIGLNYYFHSRIRFNPFRSRWGIQHNENKAVSDMGWELYPEGFLPLLTELNKHKKPIYIVEHGLADATDTRRGWYISESLKHVAKAHQVGVNIRGYFHWSLLDNFEWNLGFWPRFGLVEVDYKTQERKVRPSALLYKKIIESNSIELS